MKHCLSFSVIFLLLSLSACASKPDAVPEVSTTVQTHTAPATQTVPTPTNSKTESAVESSTPETHTEAEATGSETAANTPSLIGSWTFAVDAENGFYYTFRDHGVMQLSNELTGLLEFSDGEVTITEGTFAGTYPYVVDGNRLAANDTDKCILDLTAIDTEDASELTGLYRINRCTLYPNAEENGLCLRFDPNKLWLVAEGTYTVENTILTMVSGDSTFSQAFSFEGDKLVFTEEDGSETVLVRLPSI